MRTYIAGYGSIGKRHHRVLQELFPDLQADIHDPYLGHFSEPSGRYDIGLVCVPTSDHLTVAKSIKDRCDLLFVEKPLDSLETMERDKEDFRSTRLHVGCNIRYTTPVEALRSMKDNCRIVRVTSMSNLLGWRNDPGKLAYSFHRRLGGGVLMDFIHEPDYVYSCFGEPSRVHLVEGRIFSDVTVDSSDSCVMIWEYDRLLVTFCLSYCSKEYTRKIEVVRDDTTSLELNFNKDDIESSYKNQWIDVLNNGPSNSYIDCLKLYRRLAR